MKRLLLAAMAALLTTTPARAQSAPPLPADSLERGRKYSAWYMEGAVDSLWAYVAPGLSGQLGSLASLTASSDGIRQRIGGVRKVVEERFTWRMGSRQFWQTIDVTNAPEPVLLRWVLGADGKIRGIGLGLVSAAPPVDSGGPVIKRP